MPRVERALSLHCRGEVRRDGLKLRSCKTRLEIEWYARDIHPWDRLDPREIKAALFVRQSLTDTEAALERLFRILPELDEVGLTVREQTTGQIIMAGTVHRSAPTPSTRLSLGMQLRERGIRYLSDGFQFEPLGQTNE